MATAQTREPDEDAEAGEELSLSPAVVDAFTPMIYDIPEADDSDATERILLQLAGAQDAFALNDPWARGEGLAFYADVPVIIESITRRESDYAGGFPYYLVVNATVKGTGERIRTTSGSVGVMGQLVKAHQLGALPLEVIPRRSKKPTKSGNYAWHLEIVR